MPNCDGCCPPAACCPSQPFAPEIGSALAIGPPGVGSEISIAQNKNEEPAVCQRKTRRRRRGKPLLASRRPRAPVVSRVAFASRARAATDSVWFSHGFRHILSSRYPHRYSHYDTSARTLARKSCRSHAHDRESSSTLSKWYTHSTYAQLSLSSLHGARLSSLTLRLPPPSQVSTRNIISRAQTRGRE